MREIKKASKQKALVWISFSINYLSNISFNYIRRNKWFIGCLVWMDSSLIKLFWTDLPLTKKYRIIPIKATLLQGQTDYRNQKSNYYRWKQLHLILLLFTIIEGHRLIWSTVCVAIFTEDLWLIYSILSEADLRMHQIILG